MSDGWWIVIVWWVNNNTEWRVKDAPWLSIGTNNYQWLLSMIGANSEQWLMANNDQELSSTIQDGES